MGQWLPCAPNLPWATFLPAPASLLHCRLSVKPANPPADDPSCLTCYRAPSANALALVKFIKFAVQQPDVWFVTYSDLVGAFAVLHALVLLQPAPDAAPNVARQAVCSWRGGMPADQRRPLPTNLPACRFGGCRAQCPRTSLPTGGAPAARCRVSKPT